MVVECHILNAIIRIVIEQVWCKFIIKYYVIANFNWKMLFIIQHI